MCVCYIFWYHLYWSLFRLIKSETGLYQEGSYLTFSDFKALSVGRQGAEESMWSAWLLRLVHHGMTRPTQLHKKEAGAAWANLYKGLTILKAPTRSQSAGVCSAFCKNVFLLPCITNNSSYSPPPERGKEKGGKSRISGILSFRKILPC